MISFPSIRLEIVAVFLLFLGGLLHAQDAGQLSRLDGAARYYLGDRDQVVMSINVWGYVQKPGQYFVPRNTDLISLISFAGGPRDGANLSEVTIVRAGQIKAGNGEAKQDENDEVPILTVDVKQSMQSGKLSQIPVLMAGDTVVIRESGGRKFQKILGFNSFVNIITAAASIAFIIDRINN